jgi:hypothetical protein
MHTKTKSQTQDLTFRFDVRRARFVLTVSKTRRTSSLRTAGHGSLVNIAPPFESRRKLSLAPGTRIKIAQAKA